MEFLNASAATIDADKKADNKMKNATHNVSSAFKFA